MPFREGIIAALVLAVLWAGQASAALAQSVDLWTVTNVAVDASAASPSAAKEAALAKGRQKAWKEVYHRLTPATEWSRQAPMTDLELEPMVKSFDISGEKHSSTRYLAVVTYVFDAASVRTALRRTGVQYSESTAKPVLVIALNGGAWQPESAWGHAWAAQARRGRLVPVAVPEGDVQDITTLAAVSSAAGWDIVKPLADKYGAGSVLLATAGKSATGMQVNMTHIKPDGRTPRSGAFARQGTEDDTALAARAAASIADGLQEDWKRTTSVDFGSQSSLVVQVPFNGIADWVGVKRKLDSTRLIQRLAVEEMNMSTARLRLDYVGKADQLQTALAQANVYLVPDDKGNWTLSRNASAANAQSPNPVVP